MQMIINCVFILFLLFSKSSFSLDYFQYEYTFKKELRKLSITEKGDFDYLTLGGKSGCYNFQGSRKGRLNNFVFSKALKKLNSKENLLNDRSLLTLVDGKNVRVLKPGKQALDKITGIIGGLMQNKKSHRLSGVTMDTKRLNRKKIKVTFKKHGDKSQEIIIPQNVNNVFSVDGIYFKKRISDYRILLTEEKKSENIFLISKSDLPKSGMIRYEDFNIAHHKKGPKKMFSLSLCDGF
jgi:hypothetical protein